MTTNGQNPQSEPTAFTPPPMEGAAPAASAPANPGGPERGSRSSGRKAVTVVLAVVGGVALLGTGGTAAVAAVGSVSSTGSTQTLDVDGITGIDLVVNASDVTVEFGDVDEARLVVTDGRAGSWTLDRDEEDLVVRSPDRVFGWWFGGWFNEDETVVLTLPESLRTAALDADLTVNAGRLEVEGDYDELDVDVSAGSLRVDGAAKSLDVEMSAGRADLLLDRVVEADLSLSAGNMDVEFTGTAPVNTSLDVSAGTLNLTVPDVVYAITQDVSAGSFDAQVETASSARNTIDVDLEAGTVKVRSQG